MPVWGVCGTSLSMATITDRARDSTLARIYGWCCADDYLMEVDADDAWTITIERA